MSKHRRNGAWYWPLSNGDTLQEVRVEPVFVANDPAPLNGALICGEGLMLSGDGMMKPYAEQNLVRRVMPGWTGPEYEFNAVFPRGQQSPKVRAFVDFLLERLDFDAGYMHELCDGSGARCPDAVAAAAIAQVMRDRAHANEDTIDVDVDPRDAVALI